jgi:hypothetical protein
MNKLTKLYRFQVVTITHFEMQQFYSYDLEVDAWNRNPDELLEAWHSHCQSSEVLQRSYEFHLLYVEETSIVRLHLEGGAE